MPFPAVINLSSLNSTNGFQISGEAAYDLSGVSVASAGDSRRPSRRPSGLPEASCSFCRVCRPRPSLLPRLQAPALERQARFDELANINLRVAEAVTAQAEQVPVPAPIQFAPQEHKGEPWRRHGAHASGTMWRS